MKKYGLLSAAVGGAASVEYIKCSGCTNSFAPASKYRGKNCPICERLLNSK